MKISEKIAPYFKRGKTFKIDDMEYEYFNHGYNSTRHNERCVEVPFIYDIIMTEVGNNILEIGNVMSNYYDVRQEFGPNYRIVDKYEKGVGVINSDIMDIPDKNKFNLIVSISTFEHIGNIGNESDEKKANLALEHAKGMLKNGGLFVCTIPIGFHKKLEASFFKHFDRVICMKRTNVNNVWVECSFDDIKDATYGSPFNAANGLLIGLYEKGTVNNNEYKSKYK